MLPNCLLEKQWQLPHPLAKMRVFLIKVLELWGKFSPRHENPPRRPGIWVDVPDPDPGFPGVHVWPAPTA